METLESVLVENGLVFSFALVGGIMLVAYALSRYATFGIVHGTSIAILLGLVLAYIGGVQTGGENGISDVALFTGVGLLGGNMLLNFGIVATAFGAEFEEMKKAGLVGAVSLFVGVILSFVIGVLFALAFGYTDATSLTTIGAGAATYIVGPVTGAALGASSDVIAISVAAGLVKAILTMAVTPFAANYIGLNNPRSAMIFGGLLGTNSGVAGGLAATDPRLVPYGAMTAAFYTGLGTLLCPSILYLLMRAIFGG